MLCFYHERKKGNYSLHEVQAFRKVKKLNIKNIFYCKLNCTEHIVYISGKCTQLIHTVSESARQSSGIRHGALYTT